MIRTEDFAARMAARREEIRAGVTTYTCPLCEYATVQNRGLRVWCIGERDGIRFHKAAKRMAEAK